MSCYTEAADPRAALLRCKWPSLAQARIEYIVCITILINPFIDAVACLCGQGKHGVQER